MMNFQEKKDYLNALATAVRIWWELNCPDIEARDAEQWKTAFKIFAKANYKKYGLAPFLFGEQALVDFFTEEYKRKIKIEKIEDFFLLVADNFRECYCGDMPEKIIFVDPEPTTRRELRKRTMKLADSFFEIRLADLKKEKESLEMKIRKELKNEIHFEGEKEIDLVGIGYFNASTDGRYSAVLQEISDIGTEKYGCSLFLKTLFDACDFLEVEEKKENFFGIEITED